MFNKILYFTARNEYFLKFFSKMLTISLSGAALMLLFNEKMNPEEIKLIRDAALLPMALAGVELLGIHTMFYKLEKHREKYFLIKFEGALEQFRNGAPSRCGL